VIYMCNTCGCKGAEGLEAETFEVFYRLQTKDGRTWLNIGDFKKREEAVEAFNQNIGKSYELRLVEFETMSEYGAPLETVDRLIMSYNRHGNKIQVYESETFEAKGYKGISASKIQVLEKYIENGGKALDYHELPYHIQRQLEMGYVHELLYQDVNRWLQDNAPNPHHAMPSWLSAEDIFSDKDEAMKRAKELGTTEIHSHKINGDTIYMPFKTHEEYKKMMKAKKETESKGHMSFGGETFEAKGYRNPYAFRKPKLVDTDKYKGHSEGHKNGSWDLYEMYGSNDKLQLEIRPLHDKWGITIPITSVGVKDAKLIADAPMLLEEVKDGNRIKEYIYQFAQYPSIKKIHLDDLIAFIEEDDERFEADSVPCEDCEHYTCISIRKIMDENKEKKGAEDDDYVEYLNQVMSYLDYGDDEYIIGGKDRSNEYFGRYGEALREYDPIAFELGKREYEENYEDEGFDAEVDYAYYQKYLNYEKNGTPIEKDGYELSWGLAELNRKELIEEILGSFEYDYLLENNMVRKIDDREEEDESLESLTSIVSKNIPDYEGLSHEQVIELIKEEGFTDLAQDELYAWRESIAIGDEVGIRNLKSLMMLRKKVSELYPENFEASGIDTFTEPFTEMKTGSILKKAILLGSLGVGAFVGNKLRK